MTTRDIITGAAAAMAAAGALLVPLAADATGRHYIDPPCPAIDDSPICRLVREAHHDASHRRYARTPASATTADQPARWCLSGGWTMFVACVY